MYGHGNNRNGMPGHIPPDRSASLPWNQPGVRDTLLHRPPPAVPTPGTGGLGGPPPYGGAPGGTPLPAITQGLQPHQQPSAILPLSNAVEAAAQKIDGSGSKDEQLKSALAQKQQLVELSQGLIGKFERLQEDYGHAKQTIATLREDVEKFGREVIDTALETLIKCGVLRACEVQPNTAPSPSQPKSNPSLPRPSAAPGPADACSFFSGALSGSCPPCAAPLPFGQCDVEEVHNSVLDLCVKLLSSSSGGEASVWFMGEVYKRMPQARDEIAAFGGLKSFCAAHPDVLVYKTGTEDKDRVCLSPRFQYLVTKSPSPTQQTSPNSLSSPTAKGCRYGRYCARIYCKFKHTKDRDAPGLREGFLEMCTRHLKDQGGSDLSSNLMNAIYREEPKAKDEIARLVRKWGGLKGFCNEVPECLVYVHDEEGSRHRVTLLQRE
mmetsp:Transcript_52437/g.128155  ORF Transcript_52437/g.128155 Transcript_52437/m.128155 type:complete len:436 (-) Transcript_52437:1006-2313(-)